MFSVTVTIALLVVTVSACVAASKMAVGKFKNLKVLPKDISEARLPAL